MRIAIVTLSFWANYGGILQGYALQRTLENLGCEACLLQPKISYRSTHPWLLMPIVFVYRAYKKYIKGDHLLRIFENPYKLIRQNTDAFIFKYLNLDFLSDKQWNASLASRYDAFIVGSDQVWRPKFNYRMGQMFLDFIKGADVKRLAYAASFGTGENEFNEQEIEKFGPLLRDFDTVSVRERSGVRLCHELFGVEAVCMIDPTLLLSVSEYSSLVEKTKTTSSAGDLLIYILDESPVINAFIKDYALHHSLTPFKVCAKVDDEKAKLAERVQPPIEQWLKGIMDAKVVVTDSFHGCVFSILFHKPFFCVGNNERGQDRFSTLLSTFGLEDRLISPSSSMNELPIDIDWDKVDAILKSKRLEAITFLRYSLNAQCSQD